MREIILTVHTVTQSADTYRFKKIFSKEAKCVCLNLIVMSC